MKIGLTFILNLPVPKKVWKARIKAWKRKNKLIMDKITKKIGGGE